MRHTQHLVRTMHTINNIHEKNRDAPANLRTSTPHIETHWSHHKHAGKGKGGGEGCGCTHVLVVLHVVAGTEVNLLVPVLRAPDVRHAHQVQLLLYPNLPHDVHLRHKIADEGWEDEGSRGRGGG